MTNDPAPNEAGGVLLAAALATMLILGIIAGVKVIFARLGLGV